MTEIEQLIEQAEATLKRVNRDIAMRKRTPPSKRSWQEILDGAPYPYLNVKNL